METLLERADGKNYSKQPRFSEPTEEFFLSVYKAVTRDLPEIPPYIADSRERDSFLRDFIPLEPNLLGVVNTVVDIDKNRGWRMIGGRNQVQKFTRIFHQFQAAPGLIGWRAGVSFASKSFWTADMGSITELGRDGVDGPIAGLYNMDPARCKLTGNEDKPLWYYPKGRTSKPIKLRYQDFVRVASLPSTDEKLNGLGYCGVSRSLDLALLMMAVYEHDRESLGAKAMKGLMLIKGISQSQWEKAMKSREANLEGMELDYYNDVAVLASSGADIDAKLVALSNLPTSFNLREWMDMLIYGYALNFGFDPSEFWPVQFGALGRGTETEIQAEKASGKGRLDFPLSFQEQIQEFLPKTLSYEFDQRDDKGDLLKAQVRQAQATVVKNMYEAGYSSAEGNLLSRPEARVIAADYGLIPRGWAELDSQAATDKEEEEGKIDTEDEPIEGEEPEETPPPPSNGKVSSSGRERRLLRDQLMQNPQVVRCAETFPKEPIVVYEYPQNIEIMLWSSGEEFQKRLLQIT